MANTKQAKKRAAQSLRLRASNRSVKTRVRGTLKTIRAAVDSTTEPKAAQALLPSTQSTLDVAARKKVLHRNTAARLKSRAAKAANKVGKK